jgi:hypothetical protein
MRFSFKYFLLVAPILIFSNANAQALSSNGKEEALEFLKGLMAPVASAERKKAGQILKARINTTYSEEFVQSSPEMKEDRLRAKGIFQLTADYLIADQTCEASKKVRLYRGIGTQPVIRPAGSNSGLQVFGEINKQIYSSFPNLPQGADIGVMAYDQMDNLRVDLNAIDWNLLFGIGRKPLVYDDEEIQGRWTHLASAHTTDSKGSPLISTSLLSTVGDQYGPPVLVLDMCPERIFPAMMIFDVFGTFWESELYVPFFILPEEVVRIEGLPCFFERQRNPSHVCPDIVDRDPVGERTRNFRKIFLNFGYRFERIFMSELISFEDSPSAGRELRKPYAKNKDEFYETLDQSNYALDQWRSSIANLKFEGSCEAAREVVESGTSFITFITDYEHLEEEPSAAEKRRLEEQSRVALHYLEQYKIDLLPICGAL